MNDKNTLNNWFQTGKKPTQEQFWAWQDSYWHKTDTIPADKVENLAATLAGKAEASALANFAKKDAANLDDSNKAAWKTALGVGALPPNLATYDPGMTNYVMMKDGTTQFAGALGKNVANSRLVSIPGASLALGAPWTLDTAGYPYYVTNLADKSADGTFSQIMVRNSGGQVGSSNGKPVVEGLFTALPYNKDTNGNYIGGYTDYLVYNPITGKLAKSDRPQVVTTNNFPSQVTVNYNNYITNSNYVPAPNTPADIADTYAIVNNITTNYQWTLFTASEIVVQKMPNSKFPPSLQGSYQIPDLFDISDGRVQTKLTAPNPYTAPGDFFSIPYLADTEYDDTLIKILLNKPMPANKDWIIRARFFCSSDGWGLGHPFNSIIGFIPTANGMDYRPQKDWINNAQDGFIRAGVYGAIDGFLQQAVIYFIKKGSKLSVLVYSEQTGGMKLDIYDYDPANDIYLRFGWAIGTLGWRGFGISAFSVKDISYWIQP